MPENDSNIETILKKSFAEEIAEHIFNHIKAKLKPDVFESENSIDNANRCLAICMQGISIKAKLYDFKSVCSEVTFNMFIENNPMFKTCKDVLHAVISEIVINEIKDNNDELSNISNQVYDLKYDNAKHIERISELEKEISEKVEEIIRLENTLVSIKSCVTQQIEKSLDNFR
jgi:chaperonin cofactor prefoldin